MAQRVLRRIHQSCRAEYVPEDKIVTEIKGTLGNIWKPVGQVKFYKGKGCAECGNTGYYGRVAVFEVLPVSEKISRLILERASSADIEHVAREEGMVTMKQDGYMKVVEGVTSVEEVLRVAQE
jgi:type II secretory ATPase GspE/PulE/Tfp pilus assembly ATPase PilB-like protein